MSTKHYRLIRCLIGLSLMAAVLVWPMPGGDETAAVFVPLAGVLALGLLAIMRGRLQHVLCVLAGALMLVLWSLKIADLGLESAYDRVFNPVVDMGLLPAAWDLASGTFGAWPAALVLGGLGIAVLALTGVMIWGLAGLARLTRGARGLLMGVCCMIVIAWAVAGALGVGVGIRADNLGYLADRMQQMQHSVRRLRAFQHELGHDPLAEPGSQPDYHALAGRDVMVIFVESYGRSAVEDPRYAQTIEPRLHAIDHALANAGLHAASGWLTSPTMGGMSWLAHGALLSGLWTDNQKRYDAMIDSQRASLNRLFHQAGWTTLAVMPAITRAWPEAAYFGYDQVYGAHDLGYAGRPFNWVTMPDQYTMSAIHRLVSAQSGPTMVETALISSHAPWTPIPELVPWDAVGDGTIFNPQTRRGDSPARVWADPARVRAQYLKAVDYSLATLGRYMARYGHDTVFIILGDHQPAPIITGEDASRDVPIHIVSDDPRLLSRLPARYWAPGMRAPHDLPVRPMSVFRESFTRAMSAHP